MSDFLLTMCTQNFMQADGVPPSIFCIGILIDMLILKVMSKITPLVKNCIVEVQHMMNCRQQKFDSCGMDYLNSAGKFPESMHQVMLSGSDTCSKAGRSPSSNSSMAVFSITTKSIVTKVLE